MAQVAATRWWGGWSAALRERWSALDPLARDALVYDATVPFALIVWWTSWVELYRQWAAIALWGYLVGAALALLAQRLLPARRVLAGRVALAVLVGGLSVLLPLGLEVAWRLGGQGAAHVQPEVVVVERAGEAAGRGRDPYVEVVRDGEVAVAGLGRPTYERFFPYLPLMAVFGLPRAAGLDLPVADARLLFSLATLALVAVALALSRGEVEGRLRVGQLLLVLPTAALPLATGGDDMPVLALGLLAAVLAARRRPLLAGLVAGAAMAMKLTAWPLGLALVLVAAGRRGRGRSRALLAAGEAAVVLPATLWGLGQGAGAFVQNVVAFPLGLAGVRSPAASNLPGHLLVEALPGLQRAWPIALVLLGGATLAWQLRRRPPRRVDEACTFTAWALLAAICLAPATRVGYLVYPLNLFAWGWLLRSSSDAPAELEQPVGEGR